MKRILALVAGFILVQLNAQTPAGDGLGKGMLWKISGNGLKKNSYVLGTIHIIPSQDYVFPKYYTKALKATENLVMEINMMDIMGQLAAMKSMMMEDKTLKDLYTQDEYDFIAQVLKDSFQMDLAMYQNVKPIFLQQQLSTAGFKGDFKSYEMELVKMGSAMDKTFGGLETVGDQMSVLDSIPLSDQAAMLLESLKDIHADQQKLMSLVKQYKAQNLDSLIAFFEEEDEHMDQHEESLLGNRNRKWIPLMEDFMRSAPTFFAVGAGHLGGDQGVIQLLRRKGYTVEAVLK